MGLSRYLQHMMSGRHRLRWLFPRPVLRRIRDAIAASECRHTGQIRFVAEAALPASWLARRHSARDRAVELFSLLRVWDTEENCGVLIYLLVAERSIQVVADRGINRRVPEGAWAEICQIMREHFQKGSFEEGVLAGIDRTTELLARHFPAREERQNELPDWPVLL